ncbi:hypothetical protein ACFTAO_06620 [Paenibacillus rhizoplanae]
MIFAHVRLLDRISDLGSAGAAIAIEAGGFHGTDEELQQVEKDANPFGTPQFPHNWMHTAESGEDSFRLAITSKNLILVFKDSGSPDVGKAEVYVDGKLVLTADPHVNSWTHCNAVILYKKMSRASSIWWKSGWRRRIRRSASPSWALAIRLKNNIRVPQRPH